MEEQKDRTKENHGPKSESDSLPNTSYTLKTQYSAYSPQPPPPPLGQPPYVPPPYMPPPYYAPPPPQYPSMYTWEIFPHLARNLIRPKEDRKPILSLISVLLIITAVLVYPMAGMFIFYGASEDVDFDGTITMQGRVINNTEDGIAGVLVEIEGTQYRTYTDSTGHYSIQNVPNGIRKVKLSADGYKEETNTLLLHPDFGSEIDFQMEKGNGTLEFNNIWFFFSISILMVTFSIFILYGAYFASRQRRFAVVLVGCILGMLIMAPSLLFTFLPAVFTMGILGSILSTTALILTITSRKAFTPNLHESESKDNKKPEVLDVSEEEMPRP